MKKSELFKNERTKKSSTLSLYLKGEDLRALKILRENDINISKLCRYALRDMAKQIEDGN